MNRDRKNQTANSATRSWKTTGFQRLLNATRHQADGIRHALMHDPAIRQVSMACLLLSVVAAVLPVSRVERLILILSSMLVVSAEYINSAIETIVDRISVEVHPLSKQAKDLGSVAVAITALMAVLSWLVIVGPLVVRVLKR